MSSTPVPAGPVDVAVVIFPGTTIGPTVTLAIAEAIASGAVRMLDALIVWKDDDGKVTIIDIDEEGDVFAVIPVVGDHQGLLSEVDAQEVAADLDFGTSALVIAWENMWAVRLRSAISDAGGSIAAHERVEDSRLVEAVAAMHNAGED